MAWKLFRSWKCKFAVEASRVRGFWARRQSCAAAVHFAHPVQPWHSHQPSNSCIDSAQWWLRKQHLWCLLSCFIYVQPSAFQRWKWKTAHLSTTLSVALKICFSQEKGQFCEQLFLWRCAGNMPLPSFTRGESWKEDFVTNSTLGSSIKELPVSPASTSHPTSHNQRVFHFMLPKSS